MLRELLQEKYGPLMADAVVYDFEDGVWGY